MAREKLTIADFATKFTRDGNRLYFDDKEIQTEVHLSPNQTLLAAAGIIFAILSAVATCTTTAITIWSTFYKKPSVNQNSGTTTSTGPSNGTVVVQPQLPTPKSDTDKAHNR